MSPTSEENNFRRNLARNIWDSFTEAQRRSINNASSVSEKKRYLKEYVAGNKDAAVVMPYLVVMYAYELQDNS